MEEPSRQEIWKMFDGISSTYDKVNRVMTFGIDGFWRRKVAKFLPLAPSLSLLDCATGTADQIISLLKTSPHISHAVGIDLSKEMIEIGRRKIAALPNGDKVFLQEASALDLPFPDHSFDCVTMSFGIRNVTDTTACLKELNRVLKPGGRLLILEGSVPSNRMVKFFHFFYMRHFLPKIAGWISKKKAAYVYLNKTIETFPSGDNFCSLLREAGFSEAQAHPLTWGVVSIYAADKPRPEK